MLNEQVAAQTREVLAELRDPVRILFFTEGAACPLCGHAAALLGELAALAPLLRVETRDLAGDAALAQELGVHHAPALLLDRAGGGRFPVRYYGLPSGHEFGAFLRVLILLSTGKGMAGVDPAAAAGIARAANLKLFVLAACPRCPEEFWRCASVAAAAPRLVVEAIDAASFADLVARHRIGSVPRILLDDAVDVPAGLPPADLIARIAAGGAPGLGLPLPRGERAG